MAVEGLVVGEDIVLGPTELTRIFQAIGGLVIAYVAFSIINLILNRKKTKELENIKQLLEKIDKKLEYKKS